MSYWLEDADGEYLGDLATNVGINQLRELGGSIEEFLDAGVADEDLLADVYNEAGDQPRTQHLKDMLDGAKAPVYVTDGCGPGEDVENVFCATGEGGGVDPSCKAGESAMGSESLLPPMIAPGTADSETSDEVTHAKEVLGRLPEDLLRESTVNKIELYDSQDASAERIDEYLANRGEEAPGDGARGLFDRENGLMIATTWASEDVDGESGRNIYHEFAHSLPDRITDPDWEDPWASEWSSHSQDEGFAEAFSEWWVCKRDPDKTFLEDFKQGKPKTTALFEGWGW